MPKQMDTIKLVAVALLLCGSGPCHAFTVPRQHPNAAGIRYSSVRMPGYVHVVTGVNNPGGVTNRSRRMITRSQFSVESPSTDLCVLRMSSNFDPPPREGSYEALAARPVLVVLDIVSILIFAAVGKASHSADGSIDLVAVGITAFPFLLSWFSITPLLGSYDSLATQDPVGALLYTARGWGLAVPVGCAIRGVIKGYIPPTSFVIVTMISTLIIIGGSRALYTVAREKLAMFP